MRIARLPSALVALSVLALAAPASAQRTDAEWLANCDRDNHNGRVNHCEVRPVDVATGGSLGLEATNGVVDVTGGDRSRVSVRARIRGWGESEDEARRMAADVRVIVDGSRVRAEGPRDGRGRGWSVGFVAEVPRAYDLELEAANGPVRVESVSGRLDVETANGPLTLVDVGGQVNARTANGPLQLEMTSQPSGSGIDARTSNGPLTIALPGNVDADVRASTTNGPISSDFDLARSGRDRWNPVSGKLEGRIGRGGIPIRAQTTNGPLSIVRRD